MLTITKYAEKHNMTRQRVHQLILQGRLKGARRVKVLGGPARGVWLIPDGAKVQALK